MNTCSVDYRYLLPDYLGSHGLYRLAAFIAVLIFAVGITVGTKPRQRFSLKSATLFACLFIVDIALVVSTLDTNEPLSSCVMKQWSQIILIIMLLSPLLLLFRFIKKRDK